MNYPYREASCREGIRRDESAEMKICPPFAIAHCRKSNQVLEFFNSSLTLSITSLCSARCSSNPP